MRGRRGEEDRRKGWNKGHIEDDRIGDGTGRTG